MGRQRNHPQTKEKEGSPEKELNEIEARNLSDIEFKVMVVLMLKDLVRTTRNLMGTTRNLVGNISACKRT